MGLAEHRRGSPVSMPTTTTPNIVKEILVGARARLPTERDWPNQRLRYVTIAIDDMTDIIRSRWGGTPLADIQAARARATCWLCDLIIGTHLRPIRHTPTDEEFGIQDTDQTCNEVMMDFERAIAAAESISTLRSLPRQHEVRELRGTNHQQPKQGSPHEQRNGHHRTCEGP